MDVSWTIKKAERRRIDPLELCCWRRLLRVPWTARCSNQLILKEISTEYSLEGLMLKIQYFGYLKRRTDSLEKTLMLGKIEGRRRRGWERVRWLDGITESMDMSLSKLRDLVNDREAWRVPVHGATKSWTWLSDWTELTGGRWSYGNTDDFTSVIGRSECLSWRLKRFSFLIFSKTLQESIRKQFLLKNFFYWSIVYLQCCASFRYTVKWICYTYIHSFSDSFPI